MGWQYNIFSGIRGANMVEGQLRCMEWEEPHIRISRSHNRNRCIAQGLGGLLHGGCYGRSVVPRRISVTHQLSRVPSMSLCNTHLCNIQSSNESSPSNGQCHEETHRPCTVSIPESSIQFLIILLYFWP